MKIAIGADHAGFEIKNQLREALSAAGHEVRDFGTASESSTDYPDYASQVGHAVSSGAADRGILVCASGIGMAIAANKIHGVRAAVASRTEEVDLMRRHNDANVLALGARFIDPGAAAGLARVFLETPFEGGRHARRVDKIAALENQP